MNYMMNIDSKFLAILSLQKLSENKFFAIRNDDFNCYVYDRKLWSYMHFSLTTLYKDPYFHSIEDEEPIR